MGWRFFYAVVATSQRKGVGMIDVKVGKNRIQVSGHANTAPHGADIVCSAVSALTLTLIRGLKEIARIEPYESVECGNICIEWQVINDTGKALVDTWFLGICGIAAEYPVIRFV
jgi:hypothetical protein